MLYRNDTVSSDLSLIYCTSAHMNMPNVLLLSSIRLPALLSTLRVKKKLEPGSLYVHSYWFWVKLCYFVLWLAVDYDDASAKEAWLPLSSIVSTLTANDGVSVTKNLRCGSVLSVTHQCHDLVNTLQLRSYLITKVFQVSGCRLGEENGGEVQYRVYNETGRALLFKL